MAVNARALQGRGRFFGWATIAADASDARQLEIRQSHLLPLRFSRHSAAPSIEVWCSELGFGPCVYKIYFLGFLSSVTSALEGGGGPRDLSVDHEL